MYRLTPYPFCLLYVSGEGPDLGGQEPVYMGSGPDEYEENDQRGADANLSTPQRPINKDSTNMRNFLQSLQTYDNLRYYAGQNER